MTISKMRKEQNRPQLFITEAIDCRFKTAIL